MEKKKGTCDNCTNERVLHKVGDKNLCLACKTILSMGEEDKKNSKKKEKNP